MIFVRVLELRKIFFASCLVLSLSACNMNNKDLEDSKYGGTFSVNLGDIPAQIFPGNILKNSEQVIATQIYDGLVKYNPRNLQIVPAIAKDWTIEHNETIYTFFLNKEAKFHDDICFKNGEGRQITAHDFKYSIEQICKNHIDNGHSIAKQLKNIKGFENFETSYRNKEKTGIKGIYAYNDTILVFDLNKPDKMFIHFLAGTNGLVFSKEGFEKYGTQNAVGSGSFILKKQTDKTKPLILVKNKKYYKKNAQNEQLPFLDTLKISFIVSAQKEISLFKEGYINALFYVPEKRISPFLDEFIDLFQKNPPYYSLKQNIGYKDEVLFTVFRSNVNDLEVNAQRFFDFSTIYLQEPKAHEIEMSK